MTWQANVLTLPSKLPAKPLQTRFMPTPKGRARLKRVES